MSRFAPPTAEQAAREASARAARQRSSASARRLVQQGSRRRSDSDTFPIRAGERENAGTTEKSSQSNWLDVAAKHATLEWVVDFGAETLRGAVQYETCVKTEGTAVFVVDTSCGLEISKAYVDDDEVPVTLGAPHAVFGTAASVPLKKTHKGAVQEVRFEHDTAERKSIPLLYPFEEPAVRRCQNKI